MQGLKHPARRFTYGDYCQWPEGERWELIDGEAYDMAPAPTRNHQDWVVELVRQIGNFLEGKPCRVYVAPFDVRLPERAEADAEVTTVVQPDIAVVCDPAKLDDAGCRGAPDFIVEVLSPGTAQKDQTLKKALYERHGVREFWLVHPVDRVLTRYRLADGRYGYGPALIEAAAGRTEVGVLPGLAIDWTFGQPEPPRSDVPHP